MIIKKIHKVKGKKAWYGYAGRLWHTEVEGVQEDHKNIEALVKKHPEFKENNFMRMALERRKHGGVLPAKKKKKKRAPTQSEATVLKNNKPDLGLLEKTVTCYYCSGSGEAGFLKCPNCKGKGTVTVDNRGL